MTDSQQATDLDCDFCDPDYRYGYDDRCPVHGYKARTPTEHEPS